MEEYNLSKASVYRYLDGITVELTSLPNNGQHPQRHEASEDAVHSLTSVLIKWIILNGSEDARRAPMTRG